jgi:threonylcarbamoyladenosine tRNA methylthiotransferase MtaB
LKIQDGCSLKCSYCVIPSIRGRSRSLDRQGVVDALAEYRKAGFQEIVLTGVNLGSWGLGLSPGDSLGGLLEFVDERLRPDPSSFRVRLSSIEPVYAAGILDLFGRLPWLARHLHLPLQSGSDRVLKLMKRPYTSLDYARLAFYIKGRMPDLSLGTDILVGFPGETEVDFIEGHEFTKALPFDYLHIFPFSPREGSKAFGLERVGPRAVKDRAMAYKALDRSMRARFQKKAVGTDALVLAETSDYKKSGRAKGLTGNYLKALLPEGFRAEPRRLFKARLEKSGNPFGFLEAIP